jgi:epoxyqueuosine reductase QueG
MLSSESIKQKARDLGFDACGIAPAADLPELRFLV